jgi:excisionase family DNA binding protein
LSRKEMPYQTMLTTGDVARIFKVHPGTIRRWCTQRKIKAYRAGPRGRLRFLREDVAIAYLDRSIQKCLKLS